MIIQLYVEGDTALSAAEDLTARLPQFHFAEEGVNKSIDWSGVVEMTGDLVGAVGGLVSIAHIIWQWRREQAKGHKTILQKVEEDRKSRLILDDTITPEDIERFLKA